jgi:transcriptional regulator with XRE-family HTH domain
MKIYKRINGGADIRKKLKHFNHSLTGSVMNEGDNLKLFRKKNNLTQQELGDIVGVKKSTVSRWESGERAMTIENIKKVSRFFKVPVGAFLSNNESYESARNWTGENSPDENQEGTVVHKAGGETDQSFEVLYEEKKKFTAEGALLSLPNIDDPDIIRTFEGFKNFDKLSPEDQEDIKDILKLALKILEKRTVSDK